ncbi:hypothetical protein C1645_840757 [Glomus cerebriforme]|uniref:Galactose oxidase n=1 Tax=Glomus cerebriforme TaxID=658196 RepID=A0A397S3W6_9GLOM|nr:hypothetical protein C1645_840757 [Glomus cerebriforme]
MSKNSLAYFISWILLQFLFGVNCQMMPFKPTVSYGHTATLIDNKLYIIGGRDINGKFVGKEFFYLDFSVPFDTQKLLLWQDLSYIDLVPPHSEAESVKGGANNDTLFLYGGEISDQTMALVYTFDSQSITWTISKITGDYNVRKFRLTAVEHYGKMYLYSGVNKVINNNVASYVFLNEMVILDTINLSWSKGSLINAPSPRADYDATLLPNDNIIYLGGVSAPPTAYMSNALTLSEVYLYNTINDNWSKKITSGKIPSNRAAFSTVLGLDGQRIIIFGGFFDDPGYLDTTLYVLDLTNFNWYIPKISGNIPKYRKFHQANVIGKYMVISFGIGYNKSVESDILLLDISNIEEYVWTTTFDPSVPNSIIPAPSLPPSSSPSPSSLQPSSSSSQLSNNIPAMAGAIVGSLFCGILLSFGGFFLYKWNKNKQKQRGIIRIQGNVN